MSDKGANEFASIRCPNCKEPIPISDALQHELAERAESKVRREIGRLEAAIATREQELESRETALAASERQLEERVRERLAPERALLNARETALVAAEAAVDARVRERLASERSDLEERLRSAARAEVAVELSDLRSARLSAEDNLRVSQQAELRLRQEKRDLDAQKATLELEVVRRIEAERTAIREQAISDAEEGHRLKDAEKDRKLQDVLRLNDELRRKVQQGSQQAQGDVLETSLEELLRAQFPLDTIDAVARGVHGADLLQRVYTRSGHFCGAIVWESKNTKNWNEDWIEKLKDDQREARADVAVIVSTVMPRDVSGCGVRDGVWITDTRTALGLATALRSGLIELAVTRRAVAGKNEAVDVLFTYLTGPEFRQRVEAILRTFADMQADLDEERRVWARRWARRGKQISRVVENTGAMYGDLQGLLGASLSPIPALEHGEADIVDTVEVEPGGRPLSADAPDAAGVS